MDKWARQLWLSQEAARWAWAVAELSNEGRFGGPPGQVKRVKDAVTGQHECFTYDHRARLTHAWTTNVDCTDEANPNGSFGPDPYDLQWTYDDIGNLTAYHDGTSWTNYTYPAAGQARPHAATAAGSRSFGYNANGEMTSRTFNGQSSTMAWDPLRRLESVTQGASATSFVYDANGQRLLRRDPGSTTLYLDGMELAASGGNTTATRYYTHGGEPVALRKSNGDVWMLGGNYLGSHSVAVLNGAGTVSQQRYLPFGGARGAANQLPEDRGFLGQVEDDSTALVYLNARYYDATLMRFVSPDPISRLANPQTLNLYSYSLNNPTSASDPLGLEAIWLDDASHPGGGYWKDDTSGGIWVSDGAGGGQWVDPVSGAVWNGEQWVDPASGAVWDESGVWVDPNNGAVYDEAIGWIDPKNGCVYTGSGWSCPTLPTSGSETTTSLYGPIIIGAPTDVYFGPNFDSAGVASGPSDMYFGPQIPVARSPGNGLSEGGQGCNVTLFGRCIGYLDLGVYGGVYGAGVQVQIDWPPKANVYTTAGLGTPGVSGTLAPGQSITTGASCQAGGGYGIGGQVGIGGGGVPEAPVPFWEVGFMTPGGAATCGVIGP